MILPHVWGHSPTLGKVETKGKEYANSVTLN